MSQDGPTPEQMAEMQAVARKRFDMMKRQDAQGDPRIPLHPKVRARQRRMAGDAAQFAWDVCGDPKTMLQALSAAAPQNVLLPVASFMAATVKAAKEATGGRGGVDQGTMLMTLQSSARFLRTLRVDAAVDFLMPIRRLVTPGGTVEDVRMMLANVTRDLYPCAPRTFTPPPGFVPPARPQLGMTLQTLTDEDIANRGD